MRISPALFILLITTALSITGCSSYVKPTLILTQTSTSVPEPQPTLTPTPIIRMIKGNLRNQVHHLENDMPGANSEGYVVPSHKEQVAFAELVIALEVGDLVHASQIATLNHYKLQYYEDRNDSNAINYLLQENKPIQKGWGLYVFRVDSASNIIVEAPHPLFDIHTPSIALDIYRALDAHALLIAGAHRNANADGSADVAHFSDSIFQSVHNVLSHGSYTSSGEVVFLQIHGFQSRDHTGYPQVVIGFGAKIPSPHFSLANKMMDALNKQGISVGLCTGDAWQDLCGTKNTQAITSDGAMFIHIELDEKIRKNDQSLITALEQVLGN